MFRRLVYHKYWTFTLRSFQFQCLLPSSSGAHSSQSHPLWTIHNIGLAKYISATPKLSEMDLTKILGKLSAKAPTHLAESWDNVGLLVEPTPPHKVAKMMLTNDLTISVMQEAIETKCDLILSYHPPIFHSMKRFRQSDVKERIIVQCIENRIAVYSPHTCLDCEEGGVNDWLIKACGEVSDIEPVKPFQEDDMVAVSKTELSKSELESLQSAEDVTTTDGLFYIKKEHMKMIDNKVKYIPLNPSKSNLRGMGRKGKLKTPCSAKTIIESIKSYLGLAHVRVAVGEGKSLDDEIKSVACCAGSGASVLGNCGADLYLTGEMSHHEVLQCTSAGSTVVLCEHSNTERGYLSVLKEDLESSLENVEIFVSKVDKDPLAIM